MLKLSYSKLFHNILNYASTANIEANIEEVRFIKLGDKTFETDFSEKWYKAVSKKVAVLKLLRSIKIYSVLFNCHTKH